MKTGLQQDLFAAPPAAPPAEFPLVLRQSRRARRLALRCIPPHTLEVVIPLRARPGEVSAFVEAHRHWIDKARRLLGSASAQARRQLPASLSLPAIGREHPVRYQPTAGHRAGCRETAAGLVIAAPEPLEEAAPILLRGWLRNEARMHLVPRLEAEATRLGLAPASVHIRLQRSRWGSCSSRGAINLNAALLLVPPELVRYLLVHELCHLKYLNHSPRYWDLVERFEPDYARLDRGLAAAWRDLPWWIFPARPSHG
jgi:predicted metal-dependent hydrolase